MHVITCSSLQKNSAFLQFSARIFAILTHAHLCPQLVKSLVLSCLFHYFFLVIWFVGLSPLAHGTNPHWLSCCHSCRNYMILS